MLKVEKYPIKLFEDESELPPEIHMLIPSDSVFLDVKVLLSGIFAYYLIPPEPTGNMVTETFVLAKPTTRIDTDLYSYVGIGDFIVDRSEEQEGMIQYVYPIFRKVKH